MYAWTYRGDRPGTPDLTVSALAAQEITFTAPSGLTRDAYYQFTVTVSGGGRSASDTVHVTVTAADKRPVADAGPDQTVDWGRRVKLTSVGSLNPYGADRLRYSWRQTSGTPAVELSDPSSSLPDFVLPSQPPVGTAATNELTLELTVTDREGVTDTDTVTVSVTNQRPTADAGPDQNVAWNDNVTLDGSDSSDSPQRRSICQLPQASPVPLAAEVGSAGGDAAELQQRRGDVPPARLVARPPWG